MTKNSRNCGLLSLALVASLLAACGSEHKPAEPPPVEETVFKDMAGAVDKARAVDGTVREHKESMDRALDENEK